MKRYVDFDEVIYRILEHKANVGQDNVIYQMAHDHIMGYLEVMEKVYTEVKE